MSSQQALIDAETALRDVTKSMALEFSELSPLMRELLAKCYIRGGIDAMEKVKKSQKDIVASNSNL